MSISTGDPYRSTPKKSTTPAAAGGPDTEGVDAPADGPVGGVLPVKPLKRTTRPASTSGQRTSTSGSSRTGSDSADRTASDGSDRTNSDGSSRTASDRADRTSGNGTGAAKTAGTGAARAKTNAARSAGTKAAPAKAAATKSTPAKTAATKTAATKSAPAAKPKAPASEEIESGGLFSARSTKPATKATKGRPPAVVGGGKGTKGRRPVAPVRVAHSRNWGPIALFVATGLAAVLIIGYGLWPVFRDSVKASWQEQVAAIEGLHNYLDEQSQYFDATLASGNHQPGLLTYPVTPPVGGPHNARWQNCMGDIYPAEIAEEHAVHSLEHGAVWVTYSPDLAPDEIDKLADRVRDVEYTLMSPFPNLDAKISLQAWGYQLKVDNADDGRIDDFISALRRNATREDGASCSGGITDATTTPLDLGGM